MGKGSVARVEEKSAWSARKWSGSEMRDGESKGDGSGG